ncbi:MAG: pyridoxamine 5'-phosphate oxidase family protein [Acidimicrobiia bacterium]
MSTWGEVRAAAPELAAAVRACFDAHVHKVIATLRRDGAPRVSGTEATFDDDEIWLGMMLDSMKVRDLQRDPRFALHSATADPKMQGGDAKLGGRAIEVLDEATIDAFVARLSVDHEEVPEERFHLFRVDVAEIVRTTVEGERLVVESWHEGSGSKRVERA